MNKKLLINQITGNWIVQSTYYSLVNSFRSFKVSISKIEWVFLENNYKYLKYIQPYLNDQLLKHKIDAFFLTSQNIEMQDRNYHLFLFDKQINKTYILKLNDNFTILQKSELTYISNDCIYVSSYIKDIHILEKICFFSKNLKVVKGIIKKQENCIGVTFASEIRIS